MKIKDESKKESKEFLCQNLSIWNCVPSSISDIKKKVSSLFSWAKPPTHLKLEFLKKVLQFTFEQGTYIVQGIKWLQKSCQQNIITICKYISGFL